MESESESLEFDVESELHFDPGSGEEEVRVSAAWKGGLEKSEKEGAGIWAKGSGEDRGRVDPALRGASSTGISSASESNGSQRAISSVRDSTEVSLGSRRADGLGGEIGPNGTDGGGTAGAAMAPSSGSHLLYTHAHPQ